MEGGYDHYHSSPLELMLCYQEGGLPLHVVLQKMMIPNFQNLLSFVASCPLNGHSRSCLFFPLNGYMSIHHERGAAVAVAAAVVVPCCCWRDPLRTTEVYGS